jgi:uncharacterized protein YyaL (SSP411 family)
VVTAVVTILAILGGIARILRPLIPPPPRTLNDYGDRGAFLVQAQNQAIHWLPLNDQDFEKAKVSRRPIFLVAGAIWSMDGRIADRSTFADGDVQALIGSDFIPVRVDCDECPEWLNAFFPLSAQALGLDRGSQVYVLSPTGSLYDYLQSGALSDHADSLTVTEDLLSEKSGSDVIGKTPTSQALDRDIDGLMSPILAQGPNYAALLRTLVAKTDAVHGGLTSDEDQVLRPEVFRFELLSNATGLVEKGLSPILHSPVVDWMDGGFFRTADRDWKQVQFDKVSVVNASMMRTAAFYGAVSKDPFGTVVAKNTFDYLVHALTVNGLISSARVGDEKPNGRSARCSFEEQDVRGFWGSNALPDEDRAWAVTNLNMELARNSQLVAYISDSDVPTKQDAMLQRVLHEMRLAKASSPAKLTQFAYADVNGFVCARLIECARLWHDQTRLSEALVLRRRLEKFRSGANVFHRAGRRGGQPELTDYLGYSDAALQDFLATGNSRSFEMGLLVLRRARQLFELKTPGAWLMARGSPAGLPHDYLAPEVADNLYESCTAREIRLMSAYAVLLRGTPENRQVSDSLDSDAKAAIKQCATAANALGPEAAGYFCAAKASRTQDTIVAVGPKAVDLANEVFALEPMSMAAAAKGAVRKDMQGLTPGVYLLRNGKRIGPIPATSWTSVFGGLTAPDTDAQTRPPSSPRQPPKPRA